MSNNINNATNVATTTNQGQVSLKEIIENADLAAGLNLNVEIGEDGKIVEPGEMLEPETAAKTETTSKTDSTVKTDSGASKTDTTTAGTNGSYPGRYVPPMKINCDLEVGVGSKNKIIYVCPGKAQYFTATAIRCSGDESITIEYDGWQPGPVIYGCLGVYKIVKSGIIFLPYHTLSEYPDEYYPADILPFKAKDSCDKDVKFDVVFTYSRCVDCECSCGK